MVDLEIAKKIFDNLYQDVNGYTLSSEGRKRLSYHDKSYTYGEVSPESFFKIISHISPKENEMFYDLGSGTGKAVILASLLFNFSKCIGIEALKELCSASEGILSRLKSEIWPHFSQELSLNTQIEFYNQDFLKYDFSDADVVFAHSTCFYNELWNNLIRRFELLKPGTRVITVTRGIVSPVLTPLFSEEHQMAWGRGTVYYYEHI